eukprot:g2109.t1
MTTSSRPKSIVKWTGLLVKFLLEVLGASGAIWGCSEAAHVRVDDNSDAWRVGAGAVGACALVLYVQDHCLAGKKSICPRTKSFVLDVLGSGGAVWGVAEIVGLRTRYPSDCSIESVKGAWAPGYNECRNSYTLWRFISWTVVAIFACDWIARWCGVSRAQILPRFRAAGTVVKRFVLEVLGGAGAIWGVAEIVYLRDGWASSHYGQPSFDIWRVPAAITFVLCFVYFLVTQKRASTERDAPVVPMKAKAWEGGVRFA